jgi:hypothetical protein
MFRALGIAAGVVSLTILAWKGFHFTFGPFLLAVLEELEKDYQIFFGIFEPYVRDAFTWLREHFGWNLQLYPHWKHAFTLVWLEQISLAKTVWREGQKREAIFSLFFGVFVALAVGLTTGTVSLDSRAFIFWIGAGYCLFNAGAQAYDATFFRDSNKSWFDAFGNLGLFMLVVFAMCVYVAAIDTTTLIQLPFSLGLAVAVALYLNLALSVVWRGAQELQGNGETRVQKFLNDARTQRGFDMLSVIGGAGFVVLLGLAGV